MSHMLQGYKILEKIAQGGNAIVYKAKQKSVNRIVAIKKLYSHFLREEKIVQRFDREAQSIAKLNHPNIINLIDYGILEDSFCIVMEYIEGPDLEKILEKQKSLPVELACYIILNILEALDYAHKNGVIHRDIKPGNVMISTDGKIKLSDFGVAQITTQESLTITGTMVGTPLYMSPEQAEGKKTDYRTDIFSIGVSFYELLTGVSPFDAENFSGIIYKIIHCSVTEPKKINQKISRNLENLVLKCLEKDKDKRYQTIDELKETLKKIMIEYQFDQKKETIITYLKEIIQSVNLKKQKIKTPNFLRIKKQRKKLSLTVLSITIILFGIILLLFNKFNKPKVLESSSKNKKIEQIEKPLTITKEIIVDKKTEQDNIPIINKSIKQKQNLKPNNFKIGYLNLNSEDGVKVVIDNNTYFTPLNKPIKLKPGIYKILVSKEGFKTKTYEIKIFEKQTLNFNVNLEELFGYLKVVVQPWARIYINGELKGETPLAQPIKLKIGKYKLRLVNPNFEDIIEEIEIKEENICLIDKNFIEIKK